MSYIEKKPINRSKVRLFLGENYYKIRKYLYWCFSKNSYSKVSNINTKLQYLIFTHKTPLYRKLKDVDIYLQKNKVENLKLALKKLNGVIINSGEYFSYWKIIGKPSYRKGYKDGIVLCPDGSFKPGIGGGLCQLSNLIYWMTLHTPLTVTERYRHSHDVFPDVKRSQPFGSGATCFYNYLDLEIKNNTNTSYQLIVYLTDDYLVGEWRALTPCNYTYEVYEKEHSMTPGFFGHYIRNNVIYRKVFNLNKELIKDEYICENHALMMYQPYLNENVKCRM